MMTGNESVLCAVGIIFALRGVAAGQSLPDFAGAHYSFGLGIEPRSHKYSFRVHSRTKDMKTTIELPDALYHRAKSMAALRGRKFKDLVEEGLRLVVEGPRKAAASRAWPN